MGDVLTLIEKAQDEVDEQKAMEVAKKLKENSFDMEDLLEQIKQVRNMGLWAKSWKCSQECPARSPMRLHRQANRRSSIWKQSSIR